MLRVQPLTVTQSLAQAARVSGGSPYNGTGVDLSGVDAPSLVIAFATWTDGTHTPKMQESDDNASFTDVAAGDQVGTFTAVSSAPGSNTFQLVNYKGGKRYIRAVLTAAGTTTGAVIGAFVINGHRQAADG